MSITTIITSTVKQTLTQRILWLPGVVLLGSLNIIFYFIVGSNALAFSMLGDILVFVYVLGPFIITALMMIAKCLILSLATLMFLFLAHSRFHTASQQKCLLCTNTNSPTSDSIGSAHNTKKVQWQMLRKNWLGWSLTILAVSLLVQIFQSYFKHAISGVLLHPFLNVIGDGDVPTEFEFIWNILLAVVGTVGLMVCFYRMYYTRSIGQAFIVAVDVLKTFPTKLILLSIALEIIGVIGLWPIQIGFWLQWQSAETVLFLVSIFFVAMVNTFRILLAISFFDRFIQTQKVSEQASMVSPTNGQLQPNVLN